MNIQIVELTGATSPKYVCPQDAKGIDVRGLYTPSGMSPSLLHRTNRLDEDGYAEVVIPIELDDIQGETNIVNNDVAMKAFNTIIGVHNIEMKVVGVSPDGKLLLYIRADVSESARIMEETVQDGFDLLDE